MEKVTLSPPRGAADWLRLYGLYLRSFPRAERKPFGVILRCWRRGRTHVYRILRDGQFAGLITTVNSPDLILLDYFAVKPRFRGRGIGSGALELVRERYEGKGVFVEIESTEEPSRDWDRRERRKQFYLSGDMIPLGVSARVFGVRMELLGWDCVLDFDGYRDFYRIYYSPRAAEHILP